MTYEILKTLHILSAFLLFGTGLGSAFFKFMSDRRGDLSAIALTNRHVVMADWLFTTPAIIFQPLSGWLLLRETGFSWSDSWVLASLALFALAGACWLPVVWLQIAMRDMAEDALLSGAALPARYHRFAGYWFMLGWPAFIAVLIIVWLMVAKPALW